MANLLDTIRSNSQKQPEQGMTDETQRLQGLLRAKSGKALGGSAVGPSSLGEQQAVTNTNQTIQNQVQPQAAIQNAQQDQQSSQIQQQEGQQRADISLANKFDNIQNKVRTSQLLNDLQRDRDTLDMRKDAARLEQVASSLRLQDKKYVDNLQREGGKRRLDNSLEFNQALTQSIFDDNQDILQKNMDGQSILNANDREFRKSLAQMGADDAYGMFREQQKAAQQQQMWQSLGALTTAGIGAYGTYANSTPATGASAAPAATGDISSGNAGSIA